MTNEEKIQIIIEAMFNGRSAVKEAETSVTQLSSGLGKAGDLLKTAFGVASMAGLVMLAEHLGTTGAAVERQEGAFKNLAAGMGVDSEAMVSAMEKASKGTISHMGLINAAARTMSSGLELNTTQISDIMKMAQSRAAAFGITTEEAYSRITTAIAFQAPRMLRGVGIVVSAKEAYDVYARSIGKTVEELTDEERQTAFMNAVMAKASTTTKDLANGADSAYNNIERLKAEMSNASDVAGKSLAPALGAISGVMADVVKWWTTGFTTLRQLVAITAMAAAELTSFASTLKDTRDLTAALDASAVSGAKAFRQFSGEVPPLNAALDDTNDKIKDVENKRIGDILKKGLPEAAKEIARYNEELGKMGAAHEKIMAKILQDEKAVSAQATADAEKGRREAAKKEQEIDEEAGRSRVSAKKSLEKALQQLDEENKTALGQIVEARRKADEAYAIDSVKLERDRLTRIQELNTSYGLRIVEAKTDREKGRLENERLAEVAAEEEKARLAQEDLKQKKEMQDKDFDNQLILANILLGKKQDLAAEAYKAELDKIAEETTRKKAAEEEVLGEQLKAISERASKEREAIEERRKEEKEAFAASSAEAAKGHKERLAQFTDLRTENQKLADAIKTLPSSFDPLIAKLRETTGFAQGLKSTVEGIASAAAGILLLGDIPGGWSGGGGGHGSGGGRGGFGAKGLSDFVVPPGFPGDTFPVYVSSGETVNVAPQGESKKGGDAKAVTFIIHGTDPWAIREEIRQYMEEEGTR